MIYYGYRRGDNDKVVDWSSVSGELTENLRNIEQEREKERNRIEGEIAEATNSINDVPMGNYESMNSFILGASNQAAEQLRIQSRLLRNGQMKPSQFARFRQNLLDGMSGYKKVADSYNTKMDEFVTRQQDMTAGQLEAYSASILQNTANLQNMVSFVDPVTGMVMNAPKDKDGKPIMDQAMSPRDMLNLAAQKYDRFDMNAQLDPIVEKYGREIQVLKSGGVLTKSDILQRRFGASKKTMDEVIDDTMKQYTPEQLSSVLLDHDGGYKVTNDPKQRDSNPDEYILIGRDGSLANRLSPELTPEQTDKARQLIKEQLLTKLDLVETPYTPPSASSAERKRAGYVKDAKANMNLMAKLFSAKDSADVNEVLASYQKNLTESVDGFIEARVDGNNLVIEYDNPEFVKYGEGERTLLRTIPMPDNFKEFVETVGPALTGNQNLIELYDEAIVDIDPSALTRGAATGAFKITSPIPIFSDIAPNIEKVDTWYMNISNRNKAIEKYIKDYKEESGMDNMSYEISKDQNTITISANGAEDQVVNVEWKRDSEDVSDDIERAIATIHNQLRRGVSTTVGGSNRKKLP